MEGLKAIPYLFLVIAISGVVGGASAVVLDKFGDTTSDVVATNTINNASQAVGDTAEQLPTVAIIGIMVVIISVIAGVFVYLRYFS